MPLHRSIASVFISLFLLLVVTSAARVVRADDADEPDEYDETARVVRISLVYGDVSLKRADSDAWEDAVANMALVEGDQISTGADGRVEIQFDTRNYVRLNHDSVLKINTLRDEGIALSIIDGTATVELAKFDHAHEYFEIDAPKSTIAAETTGWYRLSVTHQGDVSVTARSNARARIYSETSGLYLRDNHTAILVNDGPNAGDWMIVDALAFDDWDGWVKDRDKFLADNLKFDNRDRYYDPNVWGAEELDNYGDWTYDAGYGWVWCPRTTSIASYTDWAPYRYGDWVWCPPYGWTWVANEPWGWAPYHYGRWVYFNNRWGWAPRGYGYHYHRAWWRPALVAFVYVPSTFGETICWYPLRRGERDPRSRYYQKPGREWHPHAEGYANLPGRNPANRGISGVPVGRFGHHDGHPVLIDGEVAKRTLEGKPVIGRLPPPITRDNTSATAGKPERTSRPGLVSDTASGSNARVFSSRPTGATTRTAGTPLDTVLRRDRVFQGRPVKNPNAPATPTNSGSGDAGMFNRPQRKDKSVDQPAGGNSGQPDAVGASGGNTSSGSGSGNPNSKPNFEGGSGRRSSQPGNTNRGSGGDSTQVTPVRPDTNTARPVSTPRGDSTPKETPRPERTFEPKREAPVSAPRSEPRPERAPEPRRDNPAPARTESPRSESPRSESPKASPPARTESPKSESPKSESPKSSPPSKSDSQPAKSSKNNR